MTPMLEPSSAEEVCETIAWAVAEEMSLEVVGAGTKRGLGRPVEAKRVLALHGLSGVSLYQPEELVMSAAAATPLATIESELAAQNQQLAFEPPDWGPLFGAVPGTGTIAGTLACNLSGPRRFKAGAARDHFLGVKAVSGRGEIFKSGGRVVKNVTGYDMCKLLAGSFGTLAVMTEVTFKVVPAAESTRTVIVFGLDDEAAISAMRGVLRGPHEVSGAAHLPAGVAETFITDGSAAQGVTVLRLEGPGNSLSGRADRLRQILAAKGETGVLEDAGSVALWRAIRDVTPFVDADVVWRLSVPPAAAARVTSSLRESLDAKIYYDGGGGVIWLSLAPVADAGAELVRAALADAAGEALLLRADAAVRGEIAVFQPQSETLAALTRRLKKGFDPAAILNRGRMYPGV